MRTTLTLIKVKRIVQDIFICTNRPLSAIMQEIHPAENFNPKR